MADCPEAVMQAPAAKLESTACRGIPAERDAGAADVAVIPVIAVDHAGAKRRLGGMPEHPLAEARPGCIPRVGRGGILVRANAVRVAQVKRPARRPGEAERRDPGGRAARETRVWLRHDFGDVTVARGRARHGAVLLDLSDGLPARARTAYAQLHLLRVHLRCPNVASRSRARRSARAADGREGKRAAMPRTVGPCPSECGRVDRHGHMHGAGVRRGDDAESDLDGAVRIRHGRPRHRRARGRAALVVVAVQRVDRAGLGDAQGHHIAVPAAAASETCRSTVRGRRYAQS